MLKVKISSIDITLMLLIIVPISIVPHTVEVTVKYVATIYLFLKYSNALLRNKFLAILTVAYTGILTYSTYINTYSYTWTLSAFMNGMQYLTMFILFYSVSQNKGWDTVAENVLFVLGILLILNDIIMPVYQFHLSDSDQPYLLGNKFSVSYLHSLFGAVVYCLQRGKSRKKVIIIWFIYSLLISLAVKCTTGTIIAMAIMLFIFFPKVIQRIINFPLTFPIALSIENILIWGSTNLFKQPWLVKIMTDVFHKSADMTGREKLYSITLASVSKKPLFGYGYLTTLYVNTFGYGNAQNGLFHIVIQAGIIGAVIYFVMITVALQNKKKGNKMYGLYMFVFAMVIGSAVEVNLSVIFLIAVALIFAYQNASPSIADNLDAKNS